MRRQWCERRRERMGEKEAFWEREREGWEGGREEERDGTMPTRRHKYNDRPSNT